MTVNHRLPTHTRTPVLTRPSRLAASEPSTMAGSRSVAAFSHVPLETPPSSVTSSSALAAWTEMPPVTASGMWSVRRTVLSTVPVAEAVRTGAIRLIMLSAEVGSLASSPNRVRPGATVSRLVPSRSSWRSSCSRDEDEMPITAIMAAMPMAMPSADRMTRVGRARSPDAPTRSTSTAASRAGDSFACVMGLLPSRSPPTGGGRCRGRRRR